MAINNSLADDAITSGEVLMGVHFDLAYSSEKLLNLQILSKYVAARASDYEALTVENGDASAETVEKALEFDILSGLLDSEVKQLDSFVVSLQEEIVHLRDKLSFCKHKEAFAAMERKLHDCEDSLKRFQYQVSEMRTQSAKFHCTSESSGKKSWNVSVTNLLEDGEYSSMEARVKQTAEQQRNILRMLEKSWARELELGERLAESKHNQEDLKLKLQRLEGEMFRMDEMSDLMQERFFEAENIAEVLTGISKEIMGKLQIAQFSLNSALQREADLSSKLQSSMQVLSAEQSAFQACCLELNHLKTHLMEAEDKCCLANFEVVSLREKIDLLEAQLRESEGQLQHANASVEASQGEQERQSSQIFDLENLIEELNLNVSKSDSRAQSAESKCKLLAEINSDLNKELSLLRSNDSTEKVNLLEKQLRQSDTQLQHAKASIDAIREQQIMLYSALHDMENLIEDLKAKTLKAESRAENAEANCIQLTDTNLELNEQLGFLRGRVKHLEVSLLKADDVKLATAKDIGMRTRVITDLVMQLAMERERLRTQIRSITKEKGSLEEKYCKTKTDASLSVTHVGNVHVKESVFLKNDATTAQYSKQLKETVTESTATSFQADGHAKHIDACETEVGPTISAVDTIGAESNLQTVQTEEARQRNSKFVWGAVAVILISVLAMYLFQQERCPFLCFEDI
eukprot:TRINITY_DN2049_c0_g1_i1.p1 TRINITY_DN2049_c0_g1~~TRINITY_DN2049_c0_g1_i1.p1  ORF type:complete len:690 (+),score=177.63 TRINITY_DN2049_c0_g1_i1:80-2149(+)